MFREDLNGTERRGDAISGFVLEGLQERDEGSCYSATYVSTSFVGSGLLLRVTILEDQVEVKSDDDCQKA